MNHLWWYLYIAECLVALVARTAVIHRTDTLYYHERLARIHSWSGHSGGQFSPASDLLAAINIRDHVIFCHCGAPLWGIVESNQVIRPSCILGVIRHAELKIMSANLTCSAAVLLHHVALSTTGRYEWDAWGRDCRATTRIIYAAADLHFIASILYFKFRLRAFLKRLRLHHRLSTLPTMRLSTARTFHLQISSDDILHLIWRLLWVIALDDVLVLSRSRHILVLSTYSKILGRPIIHVCMLIGTRVATHPVTWEGRRRWYVWNLETVA